jgi:hypothetical protein
MKKTEMREILDWFSGRAGDHIPNKAYQELFPELANLLSELAETERRFHNTEDVSQWLFDNKQQIEGCKRKLAPGQYWSFCGETDMGQSLPALCTECGGEYKLLDPKPTDSVVSWHSGHNDPT